MNGRTPTERDSEKTGITKNYKGQEVVESNDCPGPECTQHTKEDA